MLRMLNDRMTKIGEMTETMVMGTHSIVFNESYPMNIIMTGFRWFPKFFVSLCFRQK